MLAIISRNHWYKNAAVDSSAALTLITLTLFFWIVNASSLLADNSLTTPSITSNFNKLSIAFEPNAGQTDPSVSYVAHTPGGNLFFTPTEVVFALRDGDKADATNIVRLRFIDSNPAPTIENGQMLAGAVNYIIGNDQSKWQSAIPTYSDITYAALYPGVNLQYAGTSGQLKGTYLVAPGANPNIIRWQYTGAKAVSIDKDGNLQVSITDAANDRVAVSLTEHAPAAWQVVAGEQRKVSIGYAIGADDSIGFVLGDYDAKIPLTIDPVLTYSTYLGGANSDEGRGVAVDGDGYAYIVGRTSSSDFPTWNPYLPYRGGIDVFVMKIKPGDTNPTFSTYIGSTYNGNPGSEYATGIAIDSLKNVYVTGWTTLSIGYPRVGNVYVCTVCAGTDVFVTKLDSSGSVPFYSTVIGSSGADNGNAIAVDANGNAVITGAASASDYPLYNQLRGWGGGFWDAFVTVFGPTGTLRFSTYLGGSDTDEGFGVTMDSFSNIYVTGKTASTQFPTTLGAFQPSPSRTFGWDAFVVKYKADFSMVQYSTYLGGGQCNGYGADEDRGLSITTDSQLNAYITGWTKSSCFPIQNAFQATLGGTDGIADAFITKLNAAGSGLLFSTYLGGSSDDAGSSVAIDSGNNVYVTGQTTSSNFPLRNPIQSTLRGLEDVFVTKVFSGGLSLAYSTYLGGTNYDEGYGIASDAEGNAYVTGSAAEAFPTVMPYQATYHGNSDGFLAKLSNFCASSNWCVKDAPNAGTGANELRAVTVIASDDVWAVGGKDIVQNSGQSLVEHWDGKSWNVVTSPNVGILNGVSHVSSTKIWAVGDSGIIKWNGTAWIPVSSQSDWWPIRAVAVRNSNEVWAVGNDKVLLWTNNAWSMNFQQPNSTLTGITFAKDPATDGSLKWAVGYTGTDADANRRPLILYRDATTNGDWSTQSFTQTSDSFFLSVELYNSGYVWAVGSYFDAATVSYKPLTALRTTIDQQIQWRSVPVINPPGLIFNVLYDVWVTDEGDTWAVGSWSSSIPLGGEDSPGTNARTLILHYNDTDWQVVDSPNPGQANRLRSIATLPGDPVVITSTWAVGSFAFTNGSSTQTLVENIKAPTSPKATTSYYEQTTDPVLHYYQGCSAAAKADPNDASRIVILDYGQPKDWSGQKGTYLIRSPNPQALIPDIQQAVENYMDGYDYAFRGQDLKCHAQRTPLNMTLAVGIYICTNSAKCSLALPPDASAQHAQAWANMVTELQHYALINGYSEIAVAAAIDAEPDFNPSYNESKTWIESYDATLVSAIYNFGSTDGYPGPAIGEPTPVVAYGCCSGWSVDKLYHISWGLPRAQVLPEIYKPSYARDWYRVRLWSLAQGLPTLFFAGEMSECQSSGCGGGTDFSQIQGWQVFWSQLNYDPSPARQSQLNFATDIALSGK